MVLSCCLCTPPQFYKLLIPEMMPEGTHSLPFIHSEMGLIHLNMPGIRRLTCLFRVPWDVSYHAKNGIMTDRKEGRKERRVEFCFSLRQLLF